MIGLSSLEDGLEKIRTLVLKDEVEDTLRQCARERYWPKVVRHG